MPADEVAPDIGHLQKLEPRAGQLVLDARWNGWKESALDEPVTLQTPERRCQRFLRDAGQLAPQRVEALLAVCEPAHDEDRPLARGDLDGLDDLLLAMIDRFGA